MRATDMVVETARNYKAITLRKIIRKNNFKHGNTKQTALKIEMSENIWLWQYPEKCHRGYRKA